MNNLISFKPINWLAAIAITISVNAIASSAIAQTRHNFDEGYYLRNNPDVAAAVRRGSFRSGYDHFLEHGRFENRAYRTQENYSSNSWNNSNRWNFRNYDKFGRWSNPNRDLNRDADRFYNRNGQRNWNNPFYGNYDNYGNTWGNRWNNYDRNNGNEWEVRRRINEIYQQVLGRDADWDGTQHYLNLYYQGWSLGQIQRDIANSQEARARGRYW